VPGGFAGSRKCFRHVRVRRGLSVCEESPKRLQTRERSEAEKSRREMWVDGEEASPRRLPIRQVRIGGMRDETWERC
jgi:hypothetical protein